MPTSLPPRPAVRIETAIVGAGPAALAVALQMATRLPGSTRPDRLRVHAGQRIAVVGGGLSAAHLAGGAVEDGADVVLL